MKGHASFASLGDQPVDRPHVQALVLATIANFASVRRHVGMARASALASDLATRLRELLPGSRVTAISRHTVELLLLGGSNGELEDMLRLLRRSCDEPFNLEGEYIGLTLLVGVARGDSHADEVLMSEQAEKALSQQVDGSVASEEVIDLSCDLRRAISSGELVLFYQPKIHVRRQEFTSVEALVRWRHPERGLILPGDFISAAEETGIIDQLTLWTITQAIADQRRLSKLGHDRRIFINISGQLLADTAFVDAACAMVSQSGVKLGFEVTETSVILDPDKGILNLQRFADIGVRIAIDDYGAGLSSLAYLKQLPARELKIDKLFVTQLTSSNRDPLIVRSTIDLAHALDMEVVAEGVESAAAMALLTVMGCDMVQGFLISRPLPFDALVAFLDDREQHGSSSNVRVGTNSSVPTWKRA